MPWWGWIVIGALLLGAELMVIEAEFFLVFIGVSALIVGGTVLALPWIPLWAQWLLFAGIALAAMVLFRKRVYTALRAQAPGLKDDFVGDELRESGVARHLHLVTRTRQWRCRPAYRQPGVTRLRRAREGGGKAV